MQVKCFSGENCNGCALGLLSPKTRDKLDAATGQVVADHAAELDEIRQATPALGRDGREQYTDALRERALGWLRQARTGGAGDVLVFMRSLSPHELTLGATAIQRTVMDCKFVQAE